MFIAPVNWRFRSGDRFELNANPEGERLVEPFEVADGVVIPAGAYHWRRYRVEVGTAQKRRLYAQVTWWFGGFYDGDLTQFEWSGAWNPTPLITIEFSGERNVGRLATGDFTQTLIGNRAAHQRVAGPVDCQLPPVRHRQRLGRRQHAAAMDVHAGRPICSSSTTTTCARSRSLAARVEPAAGQAAIRLADVDLWCPASGGLDSRRPPVVFN